MRIQDLTINPKLRFFCQKVLPLIYDDSLSYYECICKIASAVNMLTDDVNALIKYVQNLDKEIDDKVSDAVIQKFNEYVNSQDFNDLLLSLINEIINVQLDIYSFGFTTDLEAGKNTQDFCFVKNNETTILCDTGYYNDNIDILKANLTNNNITKLNAIYISHFDADHAGNLANILSILELDNCKAYMPPVPDSPTDTTIINRALEVESLLESYNIPIIHPAEHTTYKEGNISLTFFNTDTSYYYAITPFVYNNLSLCCKMVCGTSSIFWSGDIQELAQERIAPKMSHCNVLKSAHHALEYYISNDYFYSITPNYYFVTDGNGNVNDSTTNILKNRSQEYVMAERLGIPVLATSLAPNYVLVFSLLNGNVYCDNRLAYYNTIGNVDANALYLAGKRRATLLETTSLKDLLDSQSSNQKLYAGIPSRYTMNPFTSTALIKSIKTNSGAYYGSLNDDLQYTEIIECVTPTTQRHQHINIITNNETESSTVDNMSAGNYYTTKSIAISAGQSYDGIGSLSSYYVGDDISTDGTFVGYFRGLMVVNVFPKGSSSITLDTETEPISINVPNDYITIKVGNSDHNLLLPVNNSNGMRQTFTIPGTFGNSLPIIINNNASYNIELTLTFIKLSDRWSINKSSILS